MEGLIGGGWNRGGVRKEEEKKGWTPPDDFGEGEELKDRGWRSVSKSFTSKNSSKVVEALKASENKPVATKSISGFTQEVMGGMNGASARFSIHFKLKLVHAGVPFSENEVQFTRIRYPQSPSKK